MEWGMGEWGLGLETNISICRCHRSVAKSRRTLFDCSTPGTISLNLLKFISIELVMPSNHLTLCHPLLLLSSGFPSIRVFSNESALWIRWPKYRMDGQNIGASALASVLPVNIQG